MLIRRQRITRRRNHLTRAKHQQQVKNMTTIIDENKVSWQVKITIGTMIKINRETGIDLLNNPGSIPDDLEKLFAILYIILQSQVAEKGMTEEQFANSFMGESFSLAVDGFVSELAFFFTALDPKKCSAIKGIWRMTKEANQAISETIDNALSEVSTRLQEHAT